MTSETLTLKTKQSELEAAGYKHLGHENDWYLNPPEEKKNCKHQIHGIDDGSKCDHLYWCDECKIYWKMDSGD